MKNKDIKFCNDVQSKLYILNDHSYYYSFVLFNILQVDAFNKLFKDVINNKEISRKEFGIIVIECTKMAIAYRYIHLFGADEDGNIEKGYWSCTNYHSYFFEYENCHSYEKIIKNIKSKSRNSVSKIYKFLSFNNEDQPENQLKEVLIKDVFNYNTEGGKKGIRQLLDIIELLINKNNYYKYFKSIQGNVNYQLERANAYDYKFNISFEVEHILPQNKINTDEICHELENEIFKLGNATLLEKYINSKIRDAKFNCKLNGCYDYKSDNKIFCTYSCNSLKKKKKNYCYRNSLIQMNHDLLLKYKNKNFDKDEINQRTEELANLVVDMVFSNKFDKNK